jgi:two-component sensor histidine kinase
MNDLSVNPRLALEAERLDAVRRYDILDSPPDGSFDRITAIAARRFGVPISIVSIVDHDRIWFKSHHGLPVEQIDRRDGLCATTIMSAYPRVLTDAKLDICALANPLVAGEFGLRFYAGVPLRTHDGYNLGTLCVIDTEPREVTQAEIDDLTDLAAMVMDQLELRISARQAIAREHLLAKEIDHRVMNSLQFIASMLAVQTMSPNIRDARGELRRAANRVAAVAQIHRHFYATDASEANCLDFLRRLCADLANIIGKPVQVAGDGGKVASVFIQPVGLITTELVTNAGKYGEGGIRVSFTTANSYRQLTVSNQGEPLPADFNPETTPGMGMRLILALIREQKGRLELGTLPNGTGVKVTARFPI